MLQGLKTACDFVKLRRQSGRIVEHLQLYCTPYTEYILPEATYNVTTYALISQSDVFQPQLLPTDASKDVVRAEDRQLALSKDGTPRTRTWTGIDPIYILYTLEFFPSDNSRMQSLRIDMGDGFVDKGHG